MKPGPGCNIYVEVGMVHPVQTPEQRHFME